MSRKKFIPLPHYRDVPEEEMAARARAFFESMRTRRSVRDFSPRPVPRGIIEDCIRTAATAPSGANMQPWHFVAVGDAELKRRIRQAAEREERRFYEERAPEEWLTALEPLGTAAEKPFLERAPWLICIFAERYGLDADGKRIQHYYVNESVGIATGMLLAAVHNAGLVALTHTPSPMDFLNDILERPGNERPFLILVVGYPAENARVPDIQKKAFEDITTLK